MKEEIVLHGVVLSEHSLREFDKRLQLLTMERGKMTVWASGAKRPNSPLLAGSTLEPYWVCLCLNTFLLKASLLFRTI